MNKIHILPQTLRSKIAAGEVIERPAYAVKELIENAIDAGADTITIHIEDAGLKKITVIDNGEGMSKEDLALCFQPHATSKLTNEDMLHRITSLGFRGEALGSIAAISAVEIKSRLASEPGGSVVRITNGAFENLSPVGIPPGTTITVENLFAPVPARKKFLKTLQTEFRHITDVVSQYVLAYPSIHFHLTHNKKTIFDLPEQQEHDRIKFILGMTLFEQLLPVQFEDGYIKISGYIGKPLIATQTQQKQLIFINKRKVTDRMISLGVKEAYGTLLPAVNQPVFLLSLSLPYEVVDVNVHPRKEQVAFVDNKMIFDAVKIAVMTTLSENNLTQATVPWKDDLSTKKGETQSYSGQVLKELVLPWDRGLEEIGTDIHLLQVHQLYILSITKNGLLILDQHAAHERILYEQFVTSFEESKKKKKSYTLPELIPLELSIGDSQLLEEYTELFSSVGFTIEPFQGTTYRIREIPTVFKGRDSKKIILDMLEDLSLDKSPKSIDTRTQKMLAYLSCRAAVKSGDTLSTQQMRQIVRELEKTNNNATCPHGRPTKLSMLLTDLHKYFKRR